MHLESTPRRYKLSDETRARMSASHQGKPLSEEHRQAISHALKGIDRGGKKSPPYARMNDPRYRTWREAVLERDGHQCQEPDCKYRNRSGRGLQAHHINAWAEFEDLRYDTSNGVTLCTKHHRMREGRYVGKEFTEPELMPCLCGCGTMITEVDEQGRPRCYVNGHQRRGKTFTAESRQKTSNSLKGRPLSAEHAAKITVRNRSTEQRAAVSQATSKLPTGPKQRAFITAFASHTQAELAQLFNVSQPTISRWAKKLGLSPRRSAQQAQP